MKKKEHDLEVEFIGSQTNRLTAEEEEKLALHFKELKLKYKLQREKGVFHKVCQNFPCWESEKLGRARAYALLRLPTRTPAGRATS